jgi:hemoglobin
MIFGLLPSLAHSGQMTTAMPSVENVAPSIAQGATQKSLYERLGGYNAIAAVVDDALPRIVSDPKISRFFVGLSTNSKQHLRQLIVDFICTATSGPCVYTGRDMKTSHKGLGANDSDFNAFAADIIASLDKFKVPKKEKDELVGIVASLKGEIVER